MPIDEDNQEIIEEFVAESVDQIAEVEAILIEMESGACEADDETLNLIFRAFHSVKGTAGFLELNHVVHVTHLAESLLDMLRRGEMTLQPSQVTVFLQGLDCVKTALEEVAEEGTDTCIAERSRTVGALLQSEIDGGKVSNEDAVAPEDAVADTDAEASEASGAGDDEQELRAEFAVDSLERLKAVDSALAAAQHGEMSQELADDALGGLQTIKGNCGFIGLFELGDLCHATETGLRLVVDGSTGNVEALQAGVVALRAAIVDLSDGGEGGVSNLEELREQIASSQQAEVAMPDVAAEEPVAAEPFVTAAVVEDAPIIAVAPEQEHQGDSSSALTPPSRQEGSPKSGQKNSIRVDTIKLDELMNLVGELIIAENMVSHNEDLEGHEFESFHKAALHLNRITRSLQDLTMSVRMVPIRPTFRKMLRVARDVARKQTKDVELVLTGEGTEVDRSVVEAIGDPLVHLLRNAVDHGVEDADEREAMGKPRRGQLHLSAHHEAGEVWIVLSDDGKGLDKHKILSKAIEKGVVESGDGLTDNEILQLITEPGFSTADQLSDISGRGVGMDVVKRNIEKLRGRLEITSELGVGSTFTLRIPLTLAIVEGMQVRVGVHSYTIPLFAIRESVAVEDMSVTSLTNGDEVLELRGEFIPVLRMSNLHNIEAHATTWEEGVLVIVADAGFTMALFVDEVVGQRQTVVKPLPGYLGSMQGLAGCSILSTGKISLVVDVQTLTERVRLAA